MEGDASHRLEAARTRLDLLDRTVRYCTENYDLASATYAALDAKAQATFGVSGLFVAGTVALLNGLQGSQDVSAWTVVPVVLTYVLLVTAIVTSLLALKVREVATPMDSGALASMTMDVIGLPDAELTAEVHANWYRDQLKEWKRVIEEVERTNSRKARWLTSAQVTLIVAIVCAGLATLGISLA